MELVKKIVKVGNSSGVLLPREWYGGEARIELVKKPLDTENDILKILKPHLKDILGIYLAGSYARGEQTPHSDVDVLVITSNTNRKISRGAYSVILVSLENAKKSISGRVLPLYPMMIESRVIMNAQLLRELQSILLTKKSFRWHLETTESALKIIRGLIFDETTTGSGIIYSLILRLRSIYIVDCILNKKMYRTRDFFRLLQKNAISPRKTYAVYLSEKARKSPLEVPVEDAHALLNLALKLLQKQKWDIQKRY